MKRYRVALVEYVNADTPESAVGEAIRVMSTKWAGAGMPRAWTATDDGQPEFHCRDCGSPVRCDPDEIPLCDSCLDAIVREHEQEQDELMHEQLQAEE